MCCFTGSVRKVSATRIFAREFGAENPKRQYVVYQMNLDAPRELAMVLPIPTAENKDSSGREKAVEFINLEDYTSFFNDLDRGFPVLNPPSAALSRSAPKTASATLEVHQGGIL